MLSPVSWGAVWPLGAGSVLPHPAKAAHSRTAESRMARSRLYDVTKPGTPILLFSLYSIIHIPIIAVKSFIIWEILIC